jgi:tetratricopeptide (TPR) repeat protein
MALPSHVRSFWDDLKDGKAHAARRRFDCAIRAFGEVIRALDRDVRCPMTGTEPPYDAYFEARYERGLAHWMNNHHTEAIEDFSALLKLAPSAKCPAELVIGSYLNRGLIHAADGDPSLACAAFREVLEREPENADALHWLYIAELELSERSKIAHLTLPETLMPTINTERALIKK